MDAIRTMSLVLVVGLTVSCRNDNTEASVRSLDNLDGQTNVTKNICFGRELRFAVEPRLEVASNLGSSKELAPLLHLAVQGALSAVDDRIRAVFFGSGGSIRIGNANRCADRLTDPVTRLYLSNANGEIPACMDTDEDGVPHFYLAADVAVINHQLVRLFGLFFGDHLLRRAASELATAPQHLRVKIARLGALQRALPYAVLEDLRSKKAPGADNFAAFLKAPKSRQIITSWAFAETFDSASCNDKTRLSFAGFPQSVAIFAKILDSLNPQGRQGGRLAFQLSSEGSPDSETPFSPNETTYSDITQDSDYNYDHYIDLGNSNAAKDEAEPVDTIKNINDHLPASPLSAGASSFLYSLSKGNTERTDQFQTDIRQSGGYFQAALERFEVPANHIQLFNATSGVANANFNSKLATALQESAKDGAIDAFKAKIEPNGIHQIIDLQPDPTLLDPADSADTPAKKETAIQVVGGMAAAAGAMNEMEKATALSKRERRITDNYLNYGQVRGWLWNLFE